MSKDTGGPAFPVRKIMLCDRCEIAISANPVSSGMTLRDWFAGQALAGLASLPLDEWARVTQGKRLTAEVCAEMAYKAADGMLAERNRREQ